MMVLPSSLDGCRRMICWLRVVLAPGVFLVANSALGLSLSLTQVGGTAQDGRGVVGDTIAVAVDLAIDEDEMILAAFPTLWWDQEGGNVIDIVSAVEGVGGLLGPYPVRPINSRYLLTDSPERTGRTDRPFADGRDFGDTAAGRTLMIGFELALPVIGDDQLLFEIITNGLPGPGAFRLGVATFRLATPGVTTIGFFRDPDSTLRTVVAGARGVAFSNDQIEFTDIPVSAIGFDALRIVVVPEPSVALLLGIGLVGLAAKRRRLQYSTGYSPPGVCGVESGLENPLSGEIDVPGTSSNR